MKESTIAKLRLASRIMTGLAGLAALLVAADWMGAQVHRWAALAVAVLGYGATWCAQQIPPPEKAVKRPPVGPAAVMAIALLALPACGSLAPGYRTVLIVRDAGNMTGKTLAGACKIKRAECKAKYTLMTHAGKACTKSCREALTQWTRHVRPALNNALSATFAGLEIAWAAGKDKSDWMAMLRPAVCALLKASRQWWPIAGPRLQIVLAPLKGLEGLVCSG
jgi:hypothetical protein